MEWLILLLLVPAIVIPIVLLFGFAGCGFASGTSFPPLQAPVITAATPQTGDTIELRFTNPNPATPPVRLDILRTPKFPDPPPTAERKQKSPFFDSQVDSGKAYSYQVRAIRDADGEVSDSEVATAVTFEEAFSADLVGAGQDVDASGDCIVQRFDPPSLRRPGNLIIVVVQAASDAKLVILRATISDAEPDPAADRFDSGNQPTVISGPFFTIEAGLPLELPSTQYPVDPANPLLVAFDIHTPGNTRFTAANFCTAFTKNGTPQQPITDAATKDRSGFTERPNEVRLIRRIDVATGWPTN